ncbi:endonuclease/exonuclease/phosphatase family protein [Novosphingobium sp. 9]|uniref:endonuclease/exonuclease/phosphatase family protein n=1 Tax=Novosphingobium sp. 9 TaxID=2025349 RepID=UPI0021B55308|nr:endonuclease/exonuclease/phosphatase family protein [Novosphingobium sp. 9]
MKPLTLAFALVALMSTSLSAEIARDPAERWPTVDPDAHPAQIAILSYNVEGLPWPFAWNRGAAAHEITERLSEMRAEGTQPQVVLVQEAFGTAQRQIGMMAGYHYAAFGPGKHMDGAAVDEAAEREYLSHSHFWHGEGIGKFENSGLAVFSDYPILWTKKVAFGPSRCAGWDCLANKGALAVALAVPGQDRPVVVVDTHLNAAGDSDVKAKRQLAAYDGEVAVLAQFVQGLEADASAVVLGGDFNIGHYPQRGAMLGGALLDGAGLQMAAKENTCGAHCREPVMDDLNSTSLTSTKTLMAYRAAGNAAFAPVGDVQGFGKDPDGRMLSDHVGVMVHFALPPAKGAAAHTI